MSGQQDSHEILSVTDLIETRARENGDSFAVHTGHPDFGLEFCSLTYSQQLRAVDRICAQYDWLQPSCKPDEIPPQTVIGILNTTSWEITILELALVKLGLCPLMLSINNSAAAIANLCKTTEAVTLIHGSKFTETAREARDLLAGEGITLQLDEEKRFPLWGKGGVDDTEIKPYKARLTPKQENSRAALILHSSGSTGFPKPNYCTHHYMIENAKLSRPYAAYSALPLYHGFGHNSSFRCMYYAQPFTLFFPHLPLTAKNIVQCYEASPKSSPQTFVSVAYVLKSQLLAESEQGIEMLTKFDIVPFAGAAVPDDVGDLLVSRGVNLMSIFGATETGALLTSDRDFATDKAWNYVRREGWSLDATEMEERGDNVYEVIAKPSVTTLIAHNRPDGSYALKDLFSRHPEKKSWFKYVGRLDDTLTQTLGEKTNPVPMELTIRGHSKYVRECIVFGDGRPQIGCLLRPSEAGREIWQDRTKYMELVWPSIAEANKAAPSHSRIVPEMVDILPIDTKIPVATKMTILRPACYKLFAPLIDEVYERLERGSGSPKLEFNRRSELETFIIDTINRTLDRKTSGITATTDLFAYGVDSLQATMIRNTLVQRVELGHSIKLSQNIVFEHPSVRSLAEYLWAVKRGGTRALGVDDHHSTMWALVEKWFKVLNTSTGTANISNGHAGGAIVILTGATGSLGAHLLDQVTADPTVSRVICLSRAKSHDDSMARVTQSLKLRGRCLKPQEVAKITSYAADINAPNLGLSPNEYGDLDAATIIIHNAWPVHFGLSLESFEPFIAGTTALMNLASRIGAKFFFSSSVATVLGGTEELCLETYPSSPSSAASTGYGRSKWIVEKIMERAGKELGLEVGVLRIGQLVGDIEAGIFNETEAWPLLFQSANVVHALPVLNESLSWLPVDLAASSIKEVVLSPMTSTPALYHIVNPNLLSWSTILSGLALGGLAFTPVEREEWLSRIRSRPDPKVNPAFKLIDFYTRRLAGDPGTAKIVSVEMTRKVAPTLMNCPPVTEEMVATWVKHWNTTGFLH